MTYVETIINTYMGHKWVYPKAQFKTLRIKLSLTDVTLASPFCCKNQAMFLNFVT